MTNAAARTCFTVAEANRALPLIRSIAVDVVTEFARMREASRERRALEVEASVESVGSAGAGARARLDELKAEVNERSSRIDGYIRELEELGVDVKDLESGQVEFPSERHTRPIWLCWQVGETSVGQWRGENESFADRRPVPAGELASGPTRPERSETPGRADRSERSEGRPSS
jgi:hypothetical protein